MAGKPDYKVTTNVRVDGEDVPLNEFVSRMIAGVITGALLTLRGVGEDWKSIEIEIKRV